MVKTLHHIVDEQWLITPTSSDEPFQWETIFDNQHPVEIEIGMGKGRFLLAESSDRPEVNFVGIERARKYLRIALDRLNRMGQTNVRMIYADAEFVLERFIPSGSVQAIHIYFPDPWPKARHHKRRFFRPPVAQLLRAILQPGGFIHIATDHAEYFEHIVHILDSAGHWQNVEVWNTDAGSSDTPTATHFEIKFRREERMIHRANYQLQFS